MMDNSSVGMMTFPTEWEKKHVLNHQPVYVCCINLNAYIYIHTCDVYVMYVYMKKYLYIYVAIGKQ